ncbi:hypothetical protein REMIM1_PE00538 (plasmid) [Rhizobium etli bv. mimosae str. Mim1]|nr:hypothetical protein REMIM1_PE00538 [Rhizobium etli bv. mimosae str. Mim1]
MSVLERNRHAEVGKTLLDRSRSKLELFRFSVNRISGSAGIRGLSGYRSGLPFTPAQPGGRRSLPSRSRSSCFGGEPCK